MHVCMYTYIYIPIDLLPSTPAGNRVIVSVLEMCHFFLPASKTSLVFMRYSFVPPTSPDPWHLEHKGKVDAWPSQSSHSER